MVEHGASLQLATAFGFLVMMVAADGSFEPKMQMDPEVVPEEETSPIDKPVVFRQSAYFRKTHVFPTILKGASAFGMKGCTVQYCADDYYCNFYVDDFENAGGLCVFGIPALMTVDKTSSGYIKDRTRTNGTSDQCSIKEEDDLTIEEAFQLYASPCDHCRSLFPLGYSPSKFSLQYENDVLVNEVIKLDEMNLQWKINYSAVATDEKACQFFVLANVDLDITLRRTNTYYKYDKIDMMAFDQLMFHCKAGVYHNMNNEGATYTNGTVTIK